MRAVPTKKHKQRVIITFAIIMFLMLLLCFRVAWIQIVRADDYAQRALSQQTKDNAVEAKRGSIYDRNGKELATTIKCYTLWARPSQITDAKTESEVNEMALNIARIVGTDSQSVKNKLTAESSLVTVAKYLDKDKYTKIKELGYSGIELTEATKRYYPLGNFASQLLGSVTDENNGRTGLELQYDSYLSGIAGRSITSTDLYGNELVDGVDEYYEPKDGLNLVLTIDEAIQYYVEKAIEEACEKNDADKIECLVMNPETGEVLANAQYPGFNPNDPMTPPTLEERQAYAELSTEDKTAYLSRMWRNSLVSDTYEPGSTFKLIMASTGLEEKVITLNDSFSCSSYINVSGIVLHCSSNRAHGTQTIREAVGNSCNSVLARVAIKAGKKTVYKYLDLFGITSRTGIDYPGEAGAQVKDMATLGPVDLATTGFGQGIAVTPIQLLTAVNSIGNEGFLMKPHYVKALTDSEGNIVEEFAPEVVRQVLSKETAQEMKDIMEYVVAEGGGGNAKIAGYRIGGKTGTANKAGSGGYESRYCSSFVGMAPMDDPKVTILVVVDNPKGGFYGSVVAAPIAKTILTDVLRYMNIEPEYTEDELKRIQSSYTTVPDVTGYEFNIAAGILGGYGLGYDKPSTVKNDDNFVVEAQYPLPDTKVKTGTKVYLYNE